MVQSCASYHGVGSPIIASGLAPSNNSQRCPDACLSHGASHRGVSGRNIWVSKRCKYTTTAKTVEERITKNTGFLPEKYRVFFRTVASRHSMLPVQLKDASREMGRAVQASILRRRVNLPSREVTKVCIAVDLRLLLDRELTTPLPLAA